MAPASNMEEAAMPLTIYFSTPGTYTIEDDGILGNNTSVVRDPSGTVLFPFAHPTDTIDFIAEVPGITFIFNVTDSFGTANVSVGSLADLNLSPDHIVVRQLRTDAFITLAARGTITEGGSDAAPDITAAGLILSAVNGIGTPSNALDTQVTFMEAETNTGGINISNSGNIQIGGLTPDVAGLVVGQSGDINFSNTGFILLADGTGGQSVHGGDLSGNVTLTAIGIDADIFSNINQIAISNAGGAITLNAGRDVIFGTSGTNYNNDLLATTAVTIRAGRDFQLDGTSNIRTGAFGGVVGGPIDIQVGRNILLSASTGGLQTIQAFNGDIILTTGPGGGFIEFAMFPGAIQTTNNIFLNTDLAEIASGGLNTTGIGSVTIRPVTPGRAVDLGNPLDPPGTLGLSDDEFDLLFTLNVNIGDANTGPVDFSAPLSPFIVDNLTVRSGTDISFRSSLALPRDLTLIAGDNIFFTPASSFSSTNGSLFAFVDAAQDDLGSAGLGRLDGTIGAFAGVTLTGNFENDALIGGAAAETLRGLAGSDVLNGGGGNDRLEGGLGGDLMVGGGGDDFYFVDSLGDAIVEAMGEGTGDRVFTSVSLPLPAGAEIEIFSTTDNLGTNAIDLAGNAFKQFIFGNNGPNSLDSGGGGDVMSGFGGNDFYYIRSSSDRAVESAGNGSDRVFAAASFTLEAGSEVEILSTIDNLATTAINLTGNALTQFIFGNAGANSLDSGGGGDTMMGFGGNDFYFVRSAADRAVESAGGGTADRVFAAVTYSLEAGTQIEILSTIDNLATTAINLTGNALTQAIFGNAGANTLDSGGGAGDAMYGFGGDDFYFIRTPGDRAVEGAGAGNDRVFSAVSYTLEAGSSIEMLTPYDFASTNALDFQGNALSQSIFGNAGVNNLDGGGGGDTLVGLGGNDNYYIRSGADRAVETAGNGNDRVFALVSFTLEAGSAVEMITTIDNLATTAINLTGNELVNAIFGNAGANILNGGAGNDTLVGLDGADTYAFTSALGPGNVDSISGFVAGLDRIALDDAIFTGLAPGALPAGAFRTGTAAADADDRIIYDPASGALYFDADGNGAGSSAVHFATVATGLALNAGDFVVI